MAATRPRAGPPPLRRDPGQTAEHHRQGQQAADPLTQEGGPGHPGHAHVKGRHKQDVHPDVGCGGQGQEEEGRPGVPQGREDAGGNVVEKEEGQSPQVDVQIQPGGLHHLLRRPDQLQEGPAAQKAPRHQRQAQGSGGDEGGGHGGLHLPVGPAAEELGHHHRAADVAAKGEGDEQHGDLIAVAHRRQGALPNEFSRHQAVRDVVELLKDDAAEQGQAEPAQHRPRIAHRQIPIHGDPLLSMSPGIILALSPGVNGQNAQSAPPPKQRGRALLLSDSGTTAPASAGPGPTASRPAEPRRSPASAPPAAPRRRRAPPR